MAKNFRFGFVLSMDEKKAIEKLAVLEGGLTKAALIRRLIRQAAHQKGIQTSTSCSDNSGSNKPQKQNL